MKRPPPNALNLEGLGKEIAKVQSRARSYSERALENQDPKLGELLEEAARALYNAHRSVSVGASLLGRREREKAEEEAEE